MKIQDLMHLDNRGVHNFSLGCLDAYFYLEEFLSSGKASFHKSIVINNNKTFVFHFEEEDLELLKNRQKEGVIYSLDSLPLLKRSSFSEVAYNLKSVFDESSYQNAKKRHNRIRYPFTWLENNGFSIAPLDSKNFNSVKKLHDEWVSWKLDQPTTYKIMFPTGRYIRCCRLAISEQVGFGFKKASLDYRGFVIKQQQKIVACRVFYVHNSVAYDLAFFGESWNLPSQAMNYINVYFMKYLFDQGIQTLNCGSSLNSHLKQFKEHYPSITVSSFMYGKIKEA